MSVKGKASPQITPDIDIDDVCRSSADVLRTTPMNRFRAKGPGFSGIQKRLAELGFRPDTWIPLELAMGWRTRFYPRYKSKESVANWLRLSRGQADAQYIPLAAADAAVDEFHRDDFANVPRDVLDGNYRLDLESLARDEALVRERFPELIAETPHPESGLSVGEQTKPADRAIALILKAQREGRSVPSKKDLATAVGCHRATLARDPTFNATWATAKNLPR